MPFVTSTAGIKVWKFQHILRQEGQTSKWKSLFIFSKINIVNVAFKELQRRKIKYREWWYVSCLSRILSYALRTDFSLDPGCSFALHPYLSECSRRLSRTFQCVSTIFHKNCRPLGSAREFMAYWRWRNLEQTSVAVLTVCRRQIRLWLPLVVSVVVAFMSQLLFIFQFSCHIFYRSGHTDCCLQPLSVLSLCWTLDENWFTYISFLILTNILMYSRGKSSMQSFVTCCWCSRRLNRPNYWVSF